MSKNYDWRIKRNSYDLIESGEKTLEIRVGYPNIKRVKVGDTITFSNCSKIKFEVIRITQYSSFSEMLDNEDFTKVIPNVPKYKALKMCKKIYPKNKEALGVYVFELEKPKTKTIFTNLSKYISMPHFFLTLAKSVYTFTEDSCKGYPDYFKWYCTKQIPRIFDGNGDIIICMVDGKIAGIASLKKTKKEKKICTFLVAEKYQHKKISYNLIELAFKYLGTTKPLISVSNHKSICFVEFIKKYDWKLTQVIEPGYYNKYDREFVYNGKISK